ncbi:RNA-directed DNA polymerase, eukaryota, reverse transcriptase zinc-binding domain protein [Tanacetum coccineum]
MSEIDPEPPNLLRPIDKSNEFTKTHKKSDKSLKPKKTTRTMNPEPKVTMKHAKLVSGTSHVKKMATRSGSKECVIGIVDERMEDGFDDDKGMEAIDDVTNDGLVSEEGLGVKEVRDEVGKVDDADKRVFGNEVNNNVNDMFPELNKANLSKNNIDSSYVFDNVHVMPPPVESNPILNPGIEGKLAGIKINNGDLLRNKVRTGWDKNEIQGMKDNSNDFGESSDMRDAEMQDSGKIKNPMLFTKVVQGSDSSGNNKLKLVPCATNSKGKKVVDMDPIIEEGSKKWGLTMVGKFFGFKMSYREIVGHLKRMWRPYHLDEVIMNEGGLYFFKFKSEEGLQSVIENGPWLVAQKPLFVQRWVAGICLNKPEPSRIPLWVKIFNIPLEAWNVDGISRISNRIVDAAEGIVDTIKICFKGCNNKVLSEEEKIERRGMSMGRGGPSLRGRGGMNGRGGFNGIQVNEGKKYVPVKNNSKEKVSVMEEMQKQENMLADEDEEDKINELQGIKINIDVACDMGIPISEEESREWPHDLQDYYNNKCENMKKSEKREMIKNKIKILEGDISTSRRSIDLKAHENADANVVDEMENYGSSRNQAFDTAYDRAYKKENEKIQGLILKKQMAKVELFIMFGLTLSDAVKEGWTYDMIEFYKASIAENTQSGNESVKRIKVNEAMDDEVGEDLSANAGFMTKNVVSNFVDATMANMDWLSNYVDSNKGCGIAVGWDSNVINATLLSTFDQAMYFEVKLIHEKRKFFISFIYGENDPKDRLKLWDNLGVHLNPVNHDPWAMLSDFNVILSADEHSKGIAKIQKKKDPNSGVLKKLDRVMSNSAFMNLFGSCYANFLPYVTSDHCPALLVISDVAGMKKHLRGLNKKNGNIYEKVKILIAELKKVQLELDTDPNNAKLREEEMVFCNAYREATLDGFEAEG